MKNLILFLLIFCATSLAQEIGARYLIITHDDFYDAIQPLAQWKHKKGMRTKVAKLSEIGSSTAEIRNYIVSAYNNWQIQPEYLLLVGAPNFIPFAQISWTYTDNYYTNMDGDIYNEILSGRLTVHNTNEAQTVVNKILLYEKTPNITDSLWFKKACLIVNTDGSSDAIYWGDAHHAASLMVNNGYVEIDTLCDTHGHGVNSVLTAVNNGRAFLMYRGLASNNWCPPFAVNPDQTENGEKLPIVLSITCLTIGTGSTPATAEKWLLTGTPSIPRGASGYFATTTGGFGIAHLRSAVARGFFDAVFSDNKRTFGEACEGGRIRVYEMYPTQDGDEEYYGFTTLGDPEMNLWTASPKQIEILHDSLLSGEDDSLVVQVKLNSVPFESALVCIVLDPAIYQYGYTAGNGEIVFYFDDLVSGEMDLTVTGKNIIPHETTITVIDTSAYLAYQNHVINDSLANNNGSPESGETILLRTIIKNIGVLTADNVLGKLSTDDTLISIIDSMVSFGNINPQDSSSGLSPFVFTISPFCLNGHIVNFNLLMLDDHDNTWISDFSIIISNPGGAIGPDAYGYYIYDDTDTLTNNAPEFDWFGIAPPGPGTIVSEITDSYNDTVTYTLPFNFKYYGIDYSSIGMCTNGFLEMGYSTYRFGDNGPVPYPGGPKRLLAPFWDHFHDPGIGDIYYYNDTGNHRWIVEFKDWAHAYAHELQETFQVILLDPQYYQTPTGDGEILYLYASVAADTSNTVGIEDETESRGLQYLFNNDYNSNAAPLVANRAILITTKPPFGTTPWLYIIDYTIDDSIGGNDNGIVEPDETIDIYIDVKNRGDTTAYNIIGTLRCCDSDAEVLDSISYYGNIAIGAVANNLDDAFTVHISANPADSTIGLSLRLECNEGTYYKEDYFTIYIYGIPGVEEEHLLDYGYSFGLEVYPNPCREIVNFKLQIPSTKSQTNSNSQITLKIYDVTGRLVKNFSLPTAYSLLPTVIPWDGTDDIGCKVSEGVYFVHFVTMDPAGKTGNYTKTEKVIFLK